MAEILTDDERHGVTRIREVLGDHIPEDLDTDFNLRRWWHGHDHNIETISEKISLYLKNRKVLGFDNPKFVEEFYEREDNKKIMQYFGMSRITTDHVTSDNAVVFVENGEFDKAVLHTATTTQYLKVFFACCELVLQNILKIEKKTGRPSYGLCIFDMGKVALGNHINPNSGCNKVFRARALIWEDFYPGMIKHIVVVNPPIMLTAVWSVVKFLLGEKQRQLLKFCRNQDAIRDIVGRDMLPVAFGGNLMDKGYSTRTDCCNERKPITPTDYYVSGTIFKSYGLDKLPAATHVTVKANSKHRILCTAHRNESQYLLAWKFTTSDQVLFSVHQGEILVYPALRIVTTEVPEEDVLVVTDHEQPLVVEFANNNRFLSISINLTLIAGNILKTTELSLTA
uniref:CRAL-TRIO domain-containing protein n=1 Tax=Panagrellus redivivus TaxID=6233 RepID=A0A7E4ZXL9_PANRE